MNHILKSNLDNYQYKMCKQYGDIVVMALYDKGNCKSLKFLNKENDLYLFVKNKK